VFAVADRHRAGAWHAVVTPSNFFARKQGLYKNTSTAPAGDLALGDCVLGRVERITDRAFQIDLGVGYDTGVWENFDGEPKQHLNNLNRFFPFEVIGTDEQKRVRLSHNVFKARFLQDLVEESEYDELPVTISSVFETGDVQVRCGTVALHISRSEVTWGDPETTLELIRNMSGAEVTASVVRDNDGRACLSFKRKRPVWQLADLALRFGTRPFQLIYVDPARHGLSMARNDLLFEVVLEASTVTSQLPSIEPGTLCTVNAERLIDKQGNNYHPDTTDFPPQHTEYFLAEWRIPSIPSKQEDPQESWVHEGEAMLMLHRIPPYRYRLHRAFGPGKKITIELSGNEAWGDKPEDVRIVSPTFEGAPITAKMDWRKSDFATADFLSTLLSSTKGVIDRYEDETPVVRLTEDELRSIFDKGESYPLTILGIEERQHRKYLRVSYASAQTDMIIHEEHLAYDPHVTVNAFKDEIGQELHARYTDKEQSALCFSLLQGVERIRDVRYLSLPMECIYIGAEIRGFETYLCFEKDRSLKKISNNCFHFISFLKILAPGDRVRLVLAHAGKLNIERVQGGRGRLSCIIERQQRLSGMVIVYRNSDVRGVRLDIDGVRALYGRVSSDDLPTAKDRTRMRISVRIDAIRTDFRFDPPRYYPQIIVEEEDVVVRDAQFVEEQLARRKWYFLRGKIMSWTDNGLVVNVHGFDASLHFHVPHSEISHLRSRQQKDYWEALKRERENTIRDFRVLRMEKRSKNTVVILSLKRSRATDLTEGDHIDTNLAIDRDYAVLTHVTKARLEERQRHSNTYYFETATWRICRVQENDLALSREEKGAYLNEDKRGSLFSFKIQGKRLALKSPPIPPVHELRRNEQLTRRVLPCELLEKDDQGWHIRFREWVFKTFPQLRNVEALLLSHEPTLKLKDKCLVVFAQLDREREIAFFRLWNKAESQKRDIDIYVIRPQGQERVWLARRDDMPDMPMPIDNVTTKEKREFVSLTHRKEAQVDRLDEYLCGHPPNQPVVLTLRRNVRNEPSYIFVEFAPGQHYSLPSNRFDEPRRLNGLKRGDRVIAQAVATSGSAFRWEIKQIIREGWLDTVPISGPFFRLIEQRGVFFSEDVRFTFLRWCDRRQAMQLLWQDPSEETRITLPVSPETRITLPVSALPEMQRKSLFWLKTGDRLEGKLAVAHESIDDKPIPYSEHCVVAVDKILAGKQHCYDPPEEVEEGCVVHAKIETVASSNLQVSWELEQRYEGRLPFSEMSLLQMKAEKYALCMGLTLPLIVTSVTGGFTLSYDRYITEKVYSFEGSAVLPGEIVKTFVDGALVKFPGFLRFLPYDKLLYGYDGNGWLPESQFVFSIVREWRPQQGVIDIEKLPLAQIAYFTEQNSDDVEDLCFDAKIVYVGRNFMTVRFGKSFGSFGVIEKAYVKQRNLREGYVLRIGFQIVQDSLRLVRIKDDNMTERAREAWHRISVYFPKSFQALLRQIWKELPASKERNPSLHQLLAFAQALDDKESPWTDDAILTEIAQFLALNWRLDHVSQIRSDSYWAKLIDSFARIIANPQNALAQAEKNVTRPMRFAADYLFFAKPLKMEKRRNTLSSIKWDWDPIYDLYVQTNKERPGRCHALIAELIAGLQAGRLRDGDEREIALIKEIISRFSFNFSTFIELYWPTTSDLMGAGIQLEAFDTRLDLQEQIEPVLKGVTAGEIPEAINSVDQWLARISSITRAKSKLCRLYYLQACLYFIWQEEQECIKALESAKQWLFREARDNAQEWKERIHVLRLCALLTSTRLNQREKENSFVEYVTRYVHHYDPEQRPNSASFAFAACLALSLGDYAALGRLTQSILEKSPKQQSFLAHLLKSYLDYCQDEVISLTPRLLPDAILEAGQQLLTYEIQ
jgi:hypothetical protein